MVGFFTQLCPEPFLQGPYLVAEDEEEPALELCVDDEDNWLPDKLLVSPLDDASDPLCWNIALGRPPVH